MEDELFAEWECGKENFVRDGLLNEAEYLDPANRPKISFVLKEYAHEKPKGEFDLRSSESEFATAKYQLWSKLGKVMRAIRQPSEECAGMHLSACAFNLDKEGGHPKTDMMMLALRAMKDAHFIRRQFELYDPDITICAGTFEIFRYVLGHGYVLGHKKCEQYEVITGTESTNPAWRYERAPGKYVLGTYHPSYPSETAENFIAAIRSLKLPGTK